MKLKFKKVHQDVPTPIFATSGSAAFDVTSTLCGSVWSNTSRVFPTGLKFEIPEGYRLEVHVRSSLGFKSDVRLSNCTGIIDADYRGELMVKLFNDGEQAFHVKAGDRIAQCILVKNEVFELKEVDTLSTTNRGEGGFGSTGK